jgi:hypothetical protein
MDSAVLADALDYIRVRRRSRDGAAERAKRRSQPHDPSDGEQVALTPDNQTVVLLLLRGSLLRAAAAIPAGTFFAVLLARTMTALLFGVQPTDPLSLLTVGALVLTLAAVATLLPALRAIRRSPLAALREG